MTNKSICRAAFAALLAPALALLATAPLSAQNAPPPLKLSTAPLASGTYWIKGDAANTGFVVGPDGVVVVDAQRSIDGAKAQIAEIAKITNKPIKAVIVTHGDPDHVGGVLAYGPGVEIIVHENIRSQILATSHAPAVGPTAGYVASYGAIVSHGLPTHTVGTTEMDTIGGVPVQLIHVAPAHSSGDIVVFFPRQGVVFVGDLLVQGEADYPILHVGGSSLGWLQTMQEVLKLKANTFIAGHGGKLTRAELTALVDKVAKRRAAIKAMVYAGKSIDEIGAALPEGRKSPMFLGFNETTYSELVDGYPKQLPPWISMGPNDPRNPHTTH